MPSSLSPFPPSLPTPSLLMVPAMALNVPCRKPPLLLDFTRHLTLVWWHFRKSRIITMYLSHFPSRQNSRMTPLPPHTHTQILAPWCMHPSLHHDNPVTQWLCYMRWQRDCTDVNKVLQQIKFSQTDQLGPQCQRNRESLLLVLSHQASFFVMLGTTGWATVGGL